MVSGCNGAGKTTASFTILPEIIDCKEFVNADEIARGISPFRPEKVAFEAGRIMIHRINELLEEGETFAFETTLASLSYQKKVLEAKSKGYTVTLLYFWLQNVQIAKERVRIRVSEGGHSIPAEIIERRYFKGIRNLFGLYLPIIDEAFIFDNTDGVPELVAQKECDGELKILNKGRYNELRNCHDQIRKA